MTKCVQSLLAGDYRVTNSILKRGDTKTLKWKGNSEFANSVGCWEHHALLVCDAHHAVRIKFKERIKWTNVSSMLNPQNEEDLLAVAEYLKAIERNMEALKLIQ